MERIVLTGKNMTEIKNNAREAIRNLLTELITREFGEDCVTRVANNEISLGVLDVEIDGFVYEVPVNLEPTAKEYIDRKTGNGKPVEAYDRIEEGKIYQMAVKENAEKKEKEKAEKEAKKKRDKEAREAKKKAEKAEKQA